MIAEMIAGPITLRELRRQAVEVLQAGGIENSVCEAGWLLAPVLDIRPHVLLLDGDRRIPRPDAERVRSLVARRAAREPLQYLLGTQEFRGLEMAVTTDVLIPRPETEMLVEETIRAVTGRPRPVVADVGTGSGCIAVSVLRECPEATVYALDLSPQALAVARRNARRHGVSSRCRFVQADWLSAFSDSAGGLCDVVVSNPPYIPEGDLEGLQPEVARYEPRLALAGGPDGLAFYRRLLVEAPPLLKSGGALILEVGDGQAGVVRNMIRRVGVFDGVVCREDAAGIPRVLIAGKAA
jgi:release factor glutamine methyltransferase